MNKISVTNQNDPKLFYMVSDWLFYKARQNIRTYDILYKDYDISYKRSYNGEQYLEYLTFSEELLSLIIMESGSRISDYM